MFLEVDVFTYREHWQSGKENQKRGAEWLAKIYRHNDDKTREMMAAHKDFSTIPVSSFASNPKKSFRMAFHRDYIWSLPLGPQHS